MINPTHFIYQFNHTKAYKNLDMKHEFFTSMLKIESLTEMLNHTKKLSCFKTVAIWKIKQKSKLKIVHNENDIPAQRA